MPKQLVTLSKCFMLETLVKGKMIPQGDNLIVNRKKKIGFQSSEMKQIKFIVSPI